MRQYARVSLDPSTRYWERVCIENAHLVSLASCVCMCTCLSWGTSRSHTSARLRSIYCFRVCVLGGVTLSAPLMKSTSLLWMLIKFAGAPRPLLLCDIRNRSSHAHSSTVTVLAPVKKHKPGE